MVWGLTGKTDCRTHQLNARGLILLLIHGGIALQNLSLYIYKHSAMFTHHRPA